MERPRAVARDDLERIGKLRIAELMAGRPGFAVRIEEVATCCRRKGLGAHPVEQQGKPGGHNESITRELDCRREEARPWQAAVLAMSKLQHREHTRNADGSARRDGRREGNGPPCRIEKAIRLGGCRRRLAAVVGFERARRAIEVEKEGAATNARGLRLDEVQHELDRDRRIDGTSALAQDLAAGFARIGVRRRDHVPTRDGEALLMTPGCGLGSAAGRAGFRELLGGSVWRDECVC